MKQLFVIAMLALTPVSALAADEGFTRLVNARSLRCVLGRGTATDWETGKPVIKPDKFDTVLHFDSIDPRNGRARLIGNVGAGDVTVVVGATGLTFFEQTVFGNVSITTVFADYAKGTKEFIAVHSRHIGGLGSPQPSQYHGLCKPWQ